MTIAATVANAQTCQLEAPVDPVLRRHLFPQPQGLWDGWLLRPRHRAANTTTVQRTVSFALAARNSASASTGRFSVVLMAAASPTTTTTPTTTTSTTAPSTTTTTVPTTKTVPSSGRAPAPSTVPSASAPGVTVTSAPSSNWSGFVSSGGPYTVVKGTFTVPSLAAAVGRGEQVSEWVGVDGATSSDTALIQAGVYVAPDPSNPAGYVVPPWWEILPAAETDITTVAIKPGDSVTVTIWKLTTTWEIQSTDNTNGQGFTSPPEQYSGAGSSAEWIVEAAARCGFRCYLSRLAPYSPAIAFSDLGMSGREKSLQSVTVVQSGQSVATPSQLELGPLQRRLYGHPIRPAACKGFFRLGQKGPGAVALCTLYPSRGLRAPGTLRRAVHA